MTWYDAIEYCKGLDAYLAEVLNNETQVLLETQASLLPPTNWWLGASDEENVSEFGCYIMFVSTGWLANFVIKFWSLILNTLSQVAKLLECGFVKKSFIMNAPL